MAMAMASVKRCWVNRAVVSKNPIASCCISSSSSTLRDPIS